MLVIDGEASDAIAKTVLLNITAGIAQFSQTPRTIFQIRGLTSILMCIQDHFMSV